MFPIRDKENEENKFDISGGGQTKWNNDLESESDLNLKLNSKADIDNQIIAWVEQEKVNNDDDINNFIFLIVPSFIFSSNKNNNINSFIQSFGLNFFWFLITMVEDVAFCAMEPTAQQESTAVVHV